jgi:hypothetical protein
MKTLIYIALLASSFLIGKTWVYASDEDSGKTTRMQYVSCDAQTEQMKDIVGSPNVVLTNTTIVEVNFSLDADNTVHINSVKSEEAALEKVVYRKLNGKQINGNNIVVKNQTINLVFRPEKQTDFLIY